MENYAIDTIELKETKGIPTFWCNIMQHEYIERIAGAAAGDYVKKPEEVYIACQKAIGVNILDQFIPENPLTIGNHGYENKELTATTGAELMVLDGICIDSPEAVVDHMETIEFPKIKRAIANFNVEKTAKEILDSEIEIKHKLLPEIYKSGHEFITFPCMSYGLYGYINYFMAYGLYPEVIEKHFSLQADLALLNNKAAAAAYTEGGLLPMHRLDHDIADSRGTLVDIKSLDRIWFPHFARCLEPILKTNVRMIWHCDGNLMQMVPRLLDVGIKGFQGFQYEDGMDYEKICEMKTKDGEGLIIWGGVSVTRTLPNGKPSDIVREMKWLVDNGPKRGLFLGLSSSMAPGVPWENVETFIEGLKYYREHGRS